MSAPTSTDATTSRTRSPRRRRAIVVAVLVAAALLAVVLVWFQPQALLFDTVVEDDFPTAVPADEPDRPAADADIEAAAEQRDADATPEPDADAVAELDADSNADADADAAAPTDQPVALASGSFGSRNRYSVTGDATAYELPDASRILRLEGFESTNGPDLFVYLTVGDASEPSDAALAAEYVDLGVLRGNVGDQNYTIPADVDLASFDTVVIWCRRFGTAFGAADLT